MRIRPGAHAHEKPFMQIKDCIGLSNAKAIWDFTTGDARRFEDRTNLMLHAARSFKSQGISVDFVIMLHGGATKFGARSFADTKFAGDDSSSLGRIQAALRELTLLGGRIEVCEIAMQRSDVRRENIVNFMEIEENVFVNSIALQNRGYAYIPVN
jgi:intracellular sulfur oxidation DsrE/DsrF family protein